MARGGKREGAGRPQGSSNRTTRDVREAIAVFAQGNVERLQVWLDEIAKTDPVKASDLYVRLLEYHVPKLARTEMTGEDGGPLNISIGFRSTG